VRGDLRAFGVEAESYLAAELLRHLAEPSEIAYGLRADYYSFGAHIEQLFYRGFVPQAAAEMIAHSGLTPIVVLVLLLAALIVLGCLMDSLSMILLAVPFFWPVIVAVNGGDGITAAHAAFGMNAEDLKIWFGILALIVVELGLITPPIGMNVFTVRTMMPDLKLSRIFRGVMPFVAADLVALGLLFAFPAIALWLVGVNW